ncbi:putative ribosome-binding factor A, mitochondrial [Denticeps clupeoides]|uniref:Ribosome-binding factor A, mitochondrial n=1 Tax=Denticeps clupeoides TaxID=299321 RepID=A0AAY4AY64_9TELE|nr:putative ribosome-binding factor A, mitochondrial [Denticeps clupeoides]
MFARRAQSSATSLLLRNRDARLRALAINHGPSAGSDADRPLHTSARLDGNRNKTLMKMLGSKRKKQWYYTPPRPSFRNDAVSPPKKPNQEVNQRIRVLNSVLFKAVADLLSSPEVGPEIPSFSLELSRVSLAADFCACRVYWKSSGDHDRDAQIQRLLDKSSPRIRYLIMSHQIMGHVPPVVFIKDKQYAAVTEIENLLKIADFGPNEEADRWSGSVKDVREQVLSPDLFDAETEKKRPVLFGVDHEALHKQIQEYRQRHKEPVPQDRVPALTQQQLDMLAELRKQKFIDKMKKNKKAKRLVDADVTPVTYLLEKHRELEDDYDGDFHDEQEDKQLQELMASERSES